MCLLDKIGRLGGSGADPQITCLEPARRLLGSEFLLLPSLEVATTGHSAFAASVPGPHRMMALAPSRDAETQQVSLRKELET